MVGSGRSQRPRTESRWGFPATARDERPSGRGSTERRAAAAARAWRIRDIPITVVWKVPPEGIPPARTTPRSEIGTSSGSSPTVKCAPRSCGIESKAAGVHDPGPAVAGGGVVGDVHPVDELGLAGEVDVVGAGLGAGRDQRLAVQQV